MFPSHSLNAKAAKRLEEFQFMWEDSPGNWIIWLYSTFLLLEQSLRIGAGTGFCLISLLPMPSQSLMLSLAGADTAMEK